jgi:L-seryl-tRNA(Ser) seleniumtransferase
MYVALEKFLSLDQAKVWKEWEDGVALIENAVKGIKGITTAITVNPLGNHTPRLGITWNENIRLTGKELQEKLRNGMPSIEVGGGGDKNAIGITVFMMKPGQPKIVADRVKEELTKASSS